MSGDPDWIRTSGLQFRKLPLYPAELRDPSAKRIAEFASKMHPVRLLRGVFLGRFLLFLPPLMMIGLPPGTAAEADCQPAGAEPAEIVAVTPQAGLRMRDGRELILAHLLPMDPLTTPNTDSVAARLPSWLAGQEVSWKPTGDPDRWGRIPANVFLRESRALHRAFWLQAGLTQHGWAALWPGKLTAGCLAQLLAAERRAIVAARGIWNAEVQAAALASVHDQGQAALGRQLVTILRVRTVREGQWGAFVNFVPSLHGSPAVFLSKRQMKAFRHAQSDPFSWQGKRVLLRFVVNDARLRTLRIESIDQILPID